MAFKKYPSIENTYREKEIQWWLDRYPELEHIEYVVEEKLHGANFSIEFSPDGQWYSGKRSGRIKSGENFYTFDSVLDRTDYWLLIKQWSEKAVKDQTTYHLHGELFGGGIQKGVDYGSVKRILFFDYSKEGILQPSQDFFDVMSELGLMHSVVPIISKVEGLQTALNHNTKMNSLEGPRSSEENIIEGIVIKPLKKVYVSSQGSVFILKKKNPEFKEKQKVKKKKEENVAPHILALREEFESYITEARLQGIFSKEGEIEKASQLGDYIRFFVEDAQEDFLKDQEGKTDCLSKKDKKYIFNVSKIAVEMLKKYL